MAKSRAAEQTDIPGTEQVRIPAIERAANKFAEKRRLHAGLTKEKKNALMKLVEALDANKAELSNNGNGTYSYNRGGFELILTEKESVRCVVPGDELADDDDGD
jgi:hypothetical protein